MDVADDVIELFLTQSPEVARELAEKLDCLNEERRATERAALAAIEGQLAAMLDERGEYPAECLILDHPEWHRGVLGILASRVVERTGRPALVMTHLAGEAHGSGRSVEGFHLLDALTAAHAMEAQASSEALLLRFGGHAHAVGLTLRSEKLALLRRRMRAICATHLESSWLAPPLLCDAAVEMEEFTRELAEWLERCGPFGNSNQEPVLLARGCRLAAPPRTIKDRHLCLCLEGAKGGPPVQAMGWSRGAEWAERSAALKLTRGSRVDLAFRLRWKQTQWFAGLELDLVGLRASEISQPEASQPEASQAEAVKPEAVPPG